MARAFGLHAERVTDPARLEGALSRKRSPRRPALLDVVVTQDALSSDAGKGLGWVPSYQALTAWDDAESARAEMRPVLNSARWSPRTRGCDPEDRNARFAPRADVRAMERARLPARERVARPGAEARATASRCSRTTAWSGWRSTSALAQGAGSSPCRSTFAWSRPRSSTSSSTAKRARSSCRTSCVAQVEAIRGTLALSDEACDPLRRSTARRAGPLTRH